MVKGKFPSQKGYNGELSFTLEADQAFNPYEWSPPINWKGVVGGKKVNFTQISHSGYSEEDYNFEGFKDDILDAIPFIVKAIDKALKIMD